MTLHVRTRYLQGTKQIWMIARALASKACLIGWLIKTPVGWRLCRTGTQGENEPRCDSHAADHGRWAQEKQLFVDALFV